MVALVGFMTAASAQQLQEIGISDVKVIKNGEVMILDMDIDLTELNVRNRRSVHVVPVIRNGADSLRLSPIGIYSRGRYINYLRAGESVFEDLGETVYKEGEAPKVLHYRNTVPYEPWMDGSQVSILRQTCGCCQDVMSEEYASIAEFAIPVFEPYYMYIQPEAEFEKVRHLSGTAFVDFVVSKTDINPSYRNNAFELNKIIATIDSVKNDDDVIVKHIDLKGFASPESPYDNNTRLAKGRTEALKKYVQEMYHFEDSVIRTSSEPENWEGLRAYVAATPALSNQQAVLAIIDTEMEPDAKEMKIKTQYPEDYRIMLKDSYPSLRKTDYRIEYSVNTYTDRDEIIRVFNTAPNKLSLNELYVASTAYEPGSDEFNLIFETAVKMYPMDPIANLNAASVAISTKDFKKAEKYLVRAGDSSYVIYTWGLYHMATGDYETAIFKMQNAYEGGIPEAAEMLRQCEKLAHYHKYNN